MSLKLCNLLNGGREIVDDEFLDSLADTEYGNDIRTCRNRNRLGIHDQYVAWMVDSAKPTDLEFRDGYAIGSK